MCKLKTNRTAIILTLMTFVVFANSCASFKTKYQVDHNVILTKQNITKINKTFNSIPILSTIKFQYNPKTIIKSDSLNHNNLSKYIEKNDEENIAKTIDNEVEIKIRTGNNNEISFYTLKNKEIIDSITFKYKIKNDGFLYLKDSNFKINNVPFLFGGFEINRRRLGLNEKGNLIFESSYYIYGAILVIIGDDRKIKRSSLFMEKE